MENIKKINENVEGLFKANSGNETMYILTDVLFDKTFTRVDKKTIKLRVTTEKNLIINGENFETVAIVSFVELSIGEIEFLDDVLTSIYLNKDNLTKEIGEIYEVLFALVEYIRKGNKEDLDKQKGIIGELLTILMLKEYDEDIAKLVSGKSNARFDISIDEETKVEVKSTTDKTRSHIFKLKQLSGRDKIFISSVLIDEDDRGISLYDLYKNNIHEFSKIPYEKRLEIESFAYISKGNENVIRFNLDKTFKNIRFISAEDIVEENIKGGFDNKTIQEIKISVEDIKEIDLNDIFK